MDDGISPISDSPLQSLGAELSDLLDDDQFNNVERRYLRPALAHLTELEKGRDAAIHREMVLHEDVATLQDRISELEARKIHVDAGASRFCVERYRYREALEFYSHEVRYDPKDGWLAVDRGAKAREALKN